MAIKRGSKIEKSYSAASMTDLMFLLLIFMLIATTLINPNALKLQLPKGKNQLKEKAYTTVSVTSDLQYFIETEPVSFDNLEQTLQEKLQDMETPTIALHSEETVPIGELSKIMLMAARNRYNLIMALDGN